MSIADQGGSAVSQRQLIVTADDFGLAPAVDAGILGLVDAGIVSAVSILVESADRDSVARLRDHPRAPALGLHGDVTDPLLCYDPLRTSPNEIRSRLKAQFARFHDLVGRPPDHLDTHKHKHARHPEVFQALASLAEGVPIRACDRHLRRILVRKQVPHAGACIGDAGRRPYWTRQRIQAALRTMRPGITEWVCHPACFVQQDPPVEGLPAAVRYRGQRGVEYAQLLACDFRHMLHALDIELVNWRSLLARAKRDPSQSHAACHAPSPS